MSTATRHAHRQPHLRLPGGYRLRPWTSSDAPDLVIALRDALVRRYAAHLIDDRRTAMAALAGWADHWQEGLGAAWAICGPDRQVLGSVRFGAIDAALGTGSAGYWLLPAGRGLGLASEALRTTTPVVFERLGWHRIELYHAVENDRSCAVARRCGYLPEGVMRAAMRYPVDDRLSDEHLHARLATDPPPAHRF
jgi:ribosomal-protein-alanine N-acetyltransferase